MTEHTRNQIFLERYPKFFPLQNVHLGPTRWVPKQFFKIWIFYSRNLLFSWDFWVIFKNYSMRMLSIRGNDFIAHWAYEETILSHTEHTPNKLSRMLSQRKNVNSFHMYNLYWAYGEMILSHPEHTRKWSKRWLSILGNDLIAHWAYAEMFKSRISRLNRVQF